MNVMDVMAVDFGCCKTSPSLGTKIINWTAEGCKNLYSLKDTNKVMCQKCLYFVLYGPVFSLGNEVILSKHMMFFPS